LNQREATERTHALVRSNNMPAMLKWDFSSAKSSKVCPCKEIENHRGRVAANLESNRSVVLVRQQQRHRRSVVANHSALQRSQLGVLSRQAGAESEMMVRQERGPTWPPSTLRRYRTQLTALCSAANCTAGRVYDRNGRTRLAEAWSAGDQILNQPASCSPPEGSATLPAGP
jgi:hypothetical protein